MFRDYDRRYEAEQALMGRFDHLQLEIGALFIRFQLRAYDDYSIHGATYQLIAYPYYYGKPGESVAWGFTIDSYMGRHTYADQIESVIHRGMLELLRTCASDSGYLAKQKGERLENTLQEVIQPAKPKARL